MVTLTDKYLGRPARTQQFKYALYQKEDVARYLTILDTSIAIDRVKRRMKMDGELIDELRHILMKYRIMSDKLKT